MLLSLVALALVDSINPSAIVITLYLLSRSLAAARVVVYIAAIFVTYLTLGALMMSGIDALLPTVSIGANSRVGFIVQGIIGLAMLVYAFRAPKTSRPSSRGEPRTNTIPALALLGVTVTAMELPTAVPYFGAIALLTTADVTITQWLPSLVLYNAIFVLPPVLLVAGHVVLGKRLDAKYANLRDRLQAGAHETLMWIFGLVGGALLVTSVIEYVARFVIRGG